MFNHSDTEGIRVSVQPYYLAEQSRPQDAHFVFAYRIRIENAGDLPARLVWRHWYIQDGAAGASEVEGEGVVGEQPRLEPGQVHEYQSFCVLQAESGSMEGYYEFVRDDGSRFRARIPHFLLRAWEA